MKLDNVIYSSENKTIYRDGDKVIKVFDKSFSKANVLNEALCQARVEETTDLKIPRIHEVTLIDGKWAIVSDFIEGKTLAQLMEENPDKTDEYLELFVNTQTNILSKTSPMLPKLRSKMSEKVEQSGLDATTRYELQARISGMKKHNKLCHGDFNPTNVIITPDNEVYVVDWAHATQGNASADAARTYLLFKLAGKDEIAEKYLNLFSKKTDIAKQLIQRWMPIVAASQSIKKKPEEREFLLSWVDVAEYE